MTMKLSTMFLGVSGNPFFLTVRSILLSFFEDGEVILCRRLFKGQARVEYAADPHWPKFNGIYAWLYKEPAN